MSASKKLYSRVKIMFLDKKHLHQAFKIIPMSSMSAASPDEMSSNVSRATIEPIVIARSVFGGQAVGVKFWAMSAIYKRTNIWVFLVTRLVFRLQCADLKEKSWGSVELAVTSTTQAKYDSWERIFREKANFMNIAYKQSASFH